MRALEQLVKLQQEEATEGGEENAEPAPKAEKTAHVKGIEDDLRQRLAVRLEIKVKARDRGQIVIGFETNDDFERIVAALQK